MEVRLHCIKEAGRLRVRIISPGYNKSSNCQFPSAIREEGREYIVPVEDVTLAQGTNGKFFYRIKKGNIQIINEDDEQRDIKVYGDDGECEICMDNDKAVVFAPCGHYCCCVSCGNALKKSTCPLCRTSIKQVVNKADLQ